MRTAALLCLLCLPSRPAAEAAAEADLEAIKKRLAPYAALRGGFEQAKKIRVIKKPLRSEGTFTLLKGRGVLWRTAKPMTSLVRVTREEIAQIRDGKAAVLVRVKDEPALGIIGKVLFAVFSADIDELKRHFDFVSARCCDETGHWAVALRPRDSMVRKAVARVEIEGGRLVESLALDEANGDATVIRFKDVSEIAAASKEEEALFE